MNTAKQGATVRRSTFAAMVDGTREDWEILQAEASSYNSALAERIIHHFNELREGVGGATVDKCEHSLQTATRAARANRDDEYVFCALLHDIGEALGSFNHSEVSAAIVKPFVSPQNVWMIQHHGVFQGYYYFEHFGLDPNLRDQCSGHPYFDYTAEFCSEFDQCSFDPNYNSMQFAEFEPLLRATLAGPLESIYLAQASSSAS